LADRSVTGKGDKPGWIDQVKHAGTRDSDQPSALQGASQTLRIMDETGRNG
jgi:hypothetical protein